MPGSACHHVLLWFFQFKHIICGHHNLPGSIKANAIAWPRAGGRTQQGPGSPQLRAMQCPAIPPWKLSTRLLKKLASLLNKWCVIKTKYKQPFGLSVLNTTLLNQVNYLLAEDSNLLAEDSNKSRQQSSPVLAPHLLKQNIHRLQGQSYVGSTALRDSFLLSWEWGSPSQVLQNLSWAPCCGT